MVGSVKIGTAQRWCERSVGVLAKANMYFQSDPQPKGWGYNSGQRYRRKMSAMPKGERSEWALAKATTFFLSEPQPG